MNSSTESLVFFDQVFQTPLGRLLVVGSKRRKNLAVHVFDLVDVAPDFVDVLDDVGVERLQERLVVGFDVDVKRLLGYF